MESLRGDDVDRGGGIRRLFSVNKGLDRFSYDCVGYLQVFNG